MSLVDEIKAELELLKSFLKEKFQVENIGIFGSYSRGEQKTKSEVDILSHSPNQTTNKNKPENKIQQNPQTKRSGAQKHTTT